MLVFNLERKIIESFVEFSLNTGLIFTFQTVKIFKFTFMKKLNFYTVCATTCYFFTIKIVREKRYGNLRLCVFC